MRFRDPSPAGGLQSLQPQFSGKNDTAILGSVQWVATPVEHNRAMGNIVKSTEGYRKESRSESPYLPCVGSSGNHLGTVFAARVRVISIQWKSMEGSERFRKKMQSQSEMDCDPDCVCRLCLDVPTPQADSDCKAIEVADIMKTCET